MSINPAVIEVLPTQAVDLQTVNPVSIDIVPSQPVIDLFTNTYPTFKPAIQFVILPSGTGEIDPTSYGVKYGDVNVSGTITGWTLLGDDPTGSIVIDVWRVPFSSYTPPTSPSASNSIVGSNYPSLSSSSGKVSSDLTGWNTVFSSGDIFAFKIVSASGHTEARLSLYVA